MQLKGALNELQRSTNPQALLSQMMVNNPNIANAIEYIKANGGDAQAAFYKLAQQKGINPLTILNKLK